MKWLNIEIETLRGSEFLGAEPVERATWLSLLGWCSAQENDGVIPDCSEWGSRKWQQLCGVTKEEVGIQSELYSYDGESLIVHFYPIAQQAAVKAKREAGKKGGRPKKTTTPEPLETKGEKPHGSENDNHKVQLPFNSLKGKHKRNSNSNSNVIVMEEECKSKESLVSDETKALLLSLWNNSPKQARNRSSKKKVADAWKRVKTKPSKTQLLGAIYAWCMCDDWVKDSGQFIQGLHIWIKDEKWQDLPEAAQPQQQQQTFGQIEADRRESQRTSNMNLPC
jgi:hypothetical protein